MSKYPNPESYLYLRVGNLINDIMKYYYYRNISAYLYLTTIKGRVKPNTSIEDIKKIENFLLSADFFNQKCFINDDKQNYIIRNYKLKMILNEL